MLASCGHGATRAPAGPADLAQTTSGAVRGAFADDHVLFAGIPYATPPVGPLRWRSPQPPVPWQGVRDASKFGARCVQDVTSDPDLGRSVSEDCLTLNVWAPKSRAGERLPVMVWIHGGAFVNGSGDIYDARWLVARGNIIVVTLNYRLGALGFLANPGLADHGDVGNYGLADQQAALRWVRDNIANFGGDPAKVTIAGESAGAMSVCDHLVAPGSVGLFRAAIIQSGPCQAQGDRSTAERVSIDYAAAAGCADPGSAADCLRGLPLDKLSQPPGYFRLGTDSLTGPISGTPTLPVDPMSAIANGTAARVPVLIGATHDEYTLIAALQFLRRGNMPDYSGELADAFGADSARIAAQYPVTRYGNSASAYAAVVTDEGFSCAANKMADGLSKNARAYGYEFNDRDAPAPAALRTVPFPVGASHSLELRYLFDIGGAPPLNAAQQKLSDQMIGYWTGFVATGAPRADGAPDWPAFNGSSGPWMSLDVPDVRTFDQFADEHQCAFWATR
ncbi:MAG: carboxylesterase family protein [Mycobacteriaceae bacterium]|nr:carboxylesterase family protein [Mycobacteriaceae bacterium]